MRFIIRYFFIFAFLLPLLFVKPAKLRACDDTLLALVTSSDPKSEFSRGIRQFNREIAALGSALNENRAAEFDGLLGNLMETWLGLSNRFSLNPPQEARDDPDWPRKMQESAERIGEIRKLIKEGNLRAAHDKVLGLSNHLGTFFDSFKMSGSNRVFLKMSEHFFKLHSDIASGTVSDMFLDVASLTSSLKALESFIASDTREYFQTAKMSIAALEKALSGRATPGYDTLVLTQNAEGDFLALRSRILMAEWFPINPPQPPQPPQQQQPPQPPQPRQQQQQNASPGGKP